MTNPTQSEIDKYNQELEELEEQASGAFCAPAKALEKPKEQPSNPKPKDA